MRLRSLNVGDLSVPNTVGTVLSGKKIVIIYKSLGPYHVARLRALAEICADLDVRLSCLELAGSTTVYPWIVEENDRSVEWETLFQDRSFETIPVRELWQRLRPVLEQSSSDVVMVAGYSHEIMRKVRQWAGQNGVAAVVISSSTHRDHRRARWREWLKKQVIRKFDAALVAGSRAREYINSLGIPSDRVTLGSSVVDNTTVVREVGRYKGMEAKVREELRLPDRYFLCVTRLLKIKNLERTIRAFSDYRRLKPHEASVWDLVICGSGPEEEGLRKTAQSVGDNGIHFAGFVQQPRLFAYYAAASCLVLASYSEPWGLVVNEAMAAGLPVLVSNACGCAPDLVLDGVNGWVCDPYDVKQLTEHMIKIASLGDKEREKMGQEGKRAVEDWGLERFTRGAIESCRIALERKSTD